MIRPEVARRQARDRKTQAILPLRGKILNSIAASESKLKENNEMTHSISALGCGSGANINLGRLRYSKVIILTDADSDGMHIAALLMAFFFTFMKPLVQAGHLYVALSPLYRIKFGSGAKEEAVWVYSDAEKEKVLKARPRSVTTISRFKGLGEMNPNTLWDTTLNPKTRNVLKIQIDDEAQAVAMFNSLLGKDSSDRYRLIQENATRLELDS